MAYRQLCGSPACRDFILFYYYLLNNFKATGFLNFFKLSQLITFYSVGVNSIKYFWRDMKMWICPHPTWQSLRGEEMRRRMADNCQMLMSKACRIIPQNTWGCKGAWATELRVWILMHVLNFYFFNWPSCDNSVFALSLWCMECRLMWGKKNNLKQFNIRQQHKRTWKN